MKEEKTIIELYNEIIPPNNYEFRRDFDNTELVNSLSEENKTLIENLLIKDLENNEDILLIETLAKIGSKKSVELIKKKLINNKNLNERIIISYSIYFLTKDTDMIREAYESFLKIDDKYSKVSMFYYLAKFNVLEIKNLISRFVEDEDFLVSYNAKRAIETIKLDN
ncbi:hypothetical protein [Tenacibaculum sp.]|uniref:hypothetical protein n=1 Tax=Tenacibaculum sp. TaxID=1906242 RepID=UPI003AA7E55C